MVCAMTITLITGGNRGLGFETARQLIQRGHTVWLGARDLKRGEEAAKKLGARAVQLDVTNDASVEAAARTVGTLDWWRRYGCSAGAACWRTRCESWGRERAGSPSRAWWTR